MTTTSPPRATSGAWRDGDPVGRRQFVDLGAVELERGGVLPAVRVAYETWGELNAAGDNAVLVEHALTGDSHVDGADRSRPPDTGVVGRPGRARAARSTPTATSSWPPTSWVAARAAPGPSSPAPDGAPWGSRFPFVTVRDQVQTEALLADVLGIDALARRARRLDGWHARARVGRDPPRAGRDGDRAGQHGIRDGGADRLVPGAAAGDPRRRRTSTAATTTSAAPAPTPGWGSPGGSRTSPTAASSSCTSGSAASRSRPRTRWVGAAAMPWSPTSTTTPASWPGGSTPTPTSSSPRR